MSTMKTSFQGLPREKRKEVLLNELMDNHELALAVLWLKLDPKKFEPKLTSAGDAFDEFGEWASMPTELEFDHQGAFSRFNDKVWMYQGAESKSTVKSTYYLTRVEE